MASSVMARWRTVVAGVIWLSSQSPVPRPAFQDYPATETYTGPHAAPQLTSPEARRFRTRLREAVHDGPNFAGHYTIARWGCGAGCVTTAVIDARSGQVWFAPFTIEDHWEGGHVDCHHSSDFEPTSELFIAIGHVDGKVGTFYYRWRNQAFSLLSFEATCGL